MKKESKVCVRLYSDQKALLQDYASYKGLTLSDLLHNAVIDNIKQYATELQDNLDENNDAD